MSYGYRTHCRQIVLSLLLCSPYVNASGISEINLDVTNSYGTAFGASWNVELVIPLGDASFSSSTVWQGGEPPYETSTPVTGEMRIYLSHDIFSFGPPATNPLIGIDLADLMVNGRQLFHHTQLNDQAMKVFSWTDTTDNPQSVFTANTMNQYDEVQCRDFPSSTFCTNFDYGNSTSSDFFIFGTLESGYSSRLDLGDILIRDLGTGDFSVDPDFVIYTDRANSDFSPNSNLEFSLTMSAYDPISGESTLYLTSADAVVPVPAAVWLMASGLLGLGAVARRRA